jgi:hypothetical protein
MSSKRHVEGDQALLAQPGVDQRRLADVRTAGHGQLDRLGLAVVLLVLRLRQVQRLQREFDQVADALPVRR